MNQLMWFCGGWLWFMFWVFISESAAKIINIDLNKKGEYLTATCIIISWIWICWRFIK